MWKKRQEKNQELIKTKDGVCKLIVKSILKSNMEIKTNSWMWKLFWSVNNTIKSWMINEIKTQLLIDPFEGFRKINREVVLKYKDDLQALSTKYSEKKLNLYFPLLEIWSCNLNEENHSISYSNTSRSRRYMLNYLDSDSDEDVSRDHIRNTIIKWTYIT